MATTSAHVILVAVEVVATSREAAHAGLLDWLPDTEPIHTPGPYVESWWVAEDDRTDGSDNDPAVFVSPGKQHAAARALVDAGLTPAHNIPTWLIEWDHDDKHDTDADTTEV